MTQTSGTRHFFWGGLDRDFRVVALEELPEVVSRDEAARFLDSCGDSGEGLIYRPVAIPVETDGGLVYLTFDLTDLGCVPTYLRLHFVPDLESYGSSMTESQIEAAIRELEPILDHLDQTFAIDYVSLRRPSDRGELLLSRLEPDLGRRQKPSA